MNRDDIERKLARVISKDLRDELNVLLDYLGNPPDLSKVPQSYWQNGWKHIQKDVEPILVDVFIEQAAAAMTSVGIGVDWAQINTVAANWSRAHGQTVIQQLFDKTYEGVSEIIPNFYEQGWDLKQLSAALEKYYSPVRAEMIAITEVTRATVEGDRAYVAELEKETGQQMVPIWMTAHDDLVCPICSPRNEKPIMDGVYPPAHPNCRCGVGWEFPGTLTKEQAALWQSR